MSELVGLKKNLFKLASKEKLDRRDKALLDRIMRTIKNKYQVIIIKDTQKNIYPVLKKKI
jgi:hypothetical protein